MNKCNNLVNVKKNKKLIMKRKNESSSSLFVSNDYEFDSESENGFSMENEIVGNDSDENEMLSDIEWEEVPLKNTNNDEINKNDIISFTIDSSIIPTSKKRKVESQSLKKRLKTNELKKLYFHFNIITMPFFINVLKQRSFWLNDIRLNRRLKRSVPKLITKKFKALENIEANKSEKTLKTLLIGLILWFRAHYKINSNGFRQNPYRLLSLEYLKDDKKKSIINQFNILLNEQNKYYGSRPQLDNDNFIDNIREFAKKKMTNRDTLVFFFLIILQNLIDTSKFKLSLCFALPLLDYEIDFNSNTNKLAQVPNKFDSDYLQPYFWIELEQMNDPYNKIYVIDPIAHIHEKEMVIACTKHEPVKYFESPNISSQKFSYVIAIDCKTKFIKDVSPRYIKNLSYRYFNLQLHKNIKLYSPQFKLFKWFNKCLDKFNKDAITSEAETINNRKLLEKLSERNISFPTTIKELQKSNNFIIPTMLKNIEYINPSSIPLCLWNYANRSEPLFWKDQILLLKSKQHWNILGRDIIEGVKPIKTKKYKPINTNNNGGKSKLNWHIDSQYEIKELFSWDQTKETPPFPSTYTDDSGIERKINDVDFYKNRFGHIEIYLEKMKPEGFTIIKINNNRKRTIINQYNRKHKDKIKYIEVVSGFNFKERPGYVVPIINSILMTDQDFHRAKKVFHDIKEKQALKEWNSLIKRIIIKDRLDSTYDGNI